MDLKEMIKVMQHFADGGDVLCRVKEDENLQWYKCVNPLWDWFEFDYKIKEPKQIIIIERWLMQSTIDEEYRIIDTSLVDEVAHFKKIKLLESYEVDL